MMIEKTKYVELDDDGFATESGLINVYQFDGDTGEYYGQVDDYISIGTGVAAGSTIVAPPFTKKGEVAVFAEKDWGIMPDHRGEVVYSINDGHESLITSIGDYPADTTPLKPDTEYDVWNGNSWSTDTDAKHKGDVAEAEAKKKTLLSEANSITQAWQTQLLLGIINDNDKASLITWMKYVQSVSAFDTSTAPDISWPESPSS